MSVELDGSESRQIEGGLTFEACVVERPKIDAPELSFSAVYRREVPRKGRGVGVVSVSGRHSSEW